MSDDVCFASALAECQAEFPPIKKDGEVSFNNVRFRYATLDAIRAAVTPVLAKRGIAVTQTLDDDKLTTSLLWRDQCIKSTISLPAAKDWKQVGAGITYARRYSLAALLGICADEDRDSEVADAAPVEPRRPSRAEQAKVWAKELSSKTPGEIGAAIEKRPEMYDLLPESWRERLGQMAGKQTGQ